MPNRDSRQPLERLEPTDPDSGELNVIIETPQGSRNRAHREVRSLDDLSGTLVDEIEHFFVSFNEAKGKLFEPMGRFGPDRARRLVEEGRRAHARGASASGGEGTARARSKKSSPAGGGEATARARSKKSSRAVAGGASAKGRKRP